MLKEMVIDKIFSSHDNNFTNFRSYVCRLIHSFKLTTLCYMCVCMKNSRPYFNCKFFHIYEIVVQFGKLGNL